MTKGRSIYNFFLSMIGNQRKGSPVETLHLLGLLFGGKGAPLTKGRSIYNAMIGNLSKLETQGTLDLCGNIRRKGTWKSFWKY